MQLTLFPGYPDLMGRRMAFVGYGPAPTTYSNNATTGGDTLFVPGYDSYIDCVLEIPLDPTGTAFGVAQPSIAGPRATWKIFYYTAAGAQVTTASQLTGLNFIVSGFLAGT